MVSKWVITYILTNVVYWGYNPLILTIDPNFQRDLQASVPQKTISARWFKPWRVSTMLWNRQRQVNVAAEALGWGVNWVAPLAVGAIAGPAVHGVLPDQHKGRCRSASYIARDGQGDNASYERHRYVRPRVPHISKFNRGVLWSVP